MFNKKAQGLPMQTIILIILVLIVLASVGIMFFGQFQTGTAGADSAQCVQLCQSAKAQQAQPGIDIISSSNVAINYCNSGCKEKCFLNDTQRICCSPLIDSVSAVSDTC